MGKTPLSISALFSVSGVLLVGFLWGFMHQFDAGNASEEQKAVMALPTFASCYEFRKTVQELGVTAPLAKENVFSSGWRSLNNFNPSALSDSQLQAPEFSGTNVQIEGVDESDLVKTDGLFIYTVSREEIVIVKAQPASQAEIVSRIDLEGIKPVELFVEKDRLLVFGQRSDLTTLLFYDLALIDQPKLVRSLEFEGTFKTARKVEGEVLTVINARPVMSDEIEVPRWRTLNATFPSASDEAFAPLTSCDRIHYLDPVASAYLVTILEFSMNLANQSVEPLVVMGSGENVFATDRHLYLAETQTQPGVMDVDFNLPFQSADDRTFIHKFEWGKGQVRLLGRGTVDGHVLNPFSMDEFEGNFRIATTSGRVTRNGATTSNQVFILNPHLEVMGSLNDIAPGEKIYSARFMGPRAYLVTFKKVDPFFVLDLAHPSQPSILGELKIPGYSDYLHPYNDEMILGIGKETVEGEDGNFAWMQGVKMALFDVSDVSHPKELHRVVIGDRGTDSPVLREHKAFLFDPSRQLVVLPISLVEIPEAFRSADRINPSFAPVSMSGQTTFQGAYAYRVTPEKGFEFLSRITHHEESVYPDQGYASQDETVQRSLLIENDLYTLSSKRMKIHDLNGFHEQKSVEFFPPA